MKRVIVPLLALALLGCGDAEAPADAEAPDAADAHDAAAESAPDVEAEPQPDADAVDAAPEAEAEADAAPRCPLMEAGSLQATFTEKRIAAGPCHTCGIRDDGTLECWGCNPFGQATPPDGTFVRVAAGKHHSCGIRLSGEVACWGTGEDFGQAKPTPGRFIEIAAGKLFTCGLRPDFVLECWGRDDEGESKPPCEQLVQVAAWASGYAVDGDGGLHRWPPPREEITEEPVKQVSVDQFCECFLYVSGKTNCVVAHMTSPPLQVWTETWSREGVAAVSCGHDHACAILEDGTIDCSDEFHDFTPGPDETFSEISCGHDSCCGLRTDGTAACWGDGYGNAIPPDFPGG